MPATTATTQQMSTTEPIQWVRIRSPMTGHSRVRGRRGMPFSTPRIITRVASDPPIAHAGKPQWTKLCAIATAAPSMPPWTSAYCGGAST